MQDISKVCDIGAHWQCSDARCDCACHIAWEEVEIKLVCKDPKLNENLAIREWLDKCAKILHKELKELNDASHTRT